VARREKANAVAWLERAFQQRDGGLCDIKDDVLLASAAMSVSAQCLRKMHLPE
jgi:hypothetical protein